MKTFTEFTEAYSNKSFNSQPSPKMKKDQTVVDIVRKLNSFKTTTFNSVADLQKVITSLQDDNIINRIKIPDDVPTGAMKPSKEFKGSDSSGIKSQLNDLKKKHAKDRKYSISLSNIMIRDVSNIDFYVSVSDDASTKFAKDMQSGKHGKLA